MHAVLHRYAHDGRIEIDNNAAERSIRGIALGRKNYLFAGSDKGGERAAARLRTFTPLGGNTLRVQVPSEVS